MAVAKTWCVEAVVWLLYRCGGSVVLIWCGYSDWCGCGCGFGMIGVAMVWLWYAWCGCGVIGMVVV